MALINTAAFAGEESIQLTADKGRDKVMAYCSICHSADYIQMNGGFLDRAGWEAVVNKMINIMGAPVRKEDVPEIVDYLSKNYGAKK